MSDVSKETQNALPTTGLQIVLMENFCFVSLHPVRFVVQHWDVFEPYRGMRRRHQKHRGDAEDTHGELFGTQEAPTVRKPVQNPTRFARKTPKIIDVSTTRQRYQSFSICFSVLLFNNNNNNNVRLL